MFINNTIVRKSYKPQEFIELFFFLIVCDFTFVMCSIVVVDGDIFMLCSVLKFSEEICLTALEVIHGISIIQER